MLSSIKGVLCLVLTPSARMKFLMKALWILVIIVALLVFVMMSNKRPSDLTLIQGDMISNSGSTWATFLRHNEKLIISVSPRKGIPSCDLWTQTTDLPDAHRELIPLYSKEESEIRAELEGWVSIHIHPSLRRLLEEPGMMIRTTSEEDKVLPVWYILQDIKFRSLRLNERPFPMGGESLWLANLKSDVIMTWRNLWKITVSGDSKPAT